MCDINKKTQRKTVVVYKVVEKKGGKYFSCLSGMRLNVGILNPKYRSRYIENQYFNTNMIGKTSGFKLKSDAILYCKEIRRKTPDYLAGYLPKIKKGDLIILKIVLGGEIMEGTANNICESIRDDHITFAGSKILSFNEVKF